MSELRLCRATLDTENDLTCNFEDEVEIQPTGLWHCPDCRRGSRQTKKTQGYLYE